MFRFILLSIELTTLIPYNGILMISIVEIFYFIYLVGFGEMGWSVARDLSVGVRSESVDAYAIFTICVVLLLLILSELINHREEL